ncbi:4297_t:CDS:1, partial [Acaulospora morrowiae]
IKTYVCWKQTDDLKHTFKGRSAGNFQTSEQTVGYTRVDLTLKTECENYTHVEEYELIHTCERRHHKLFLSIKPYVCWKQTDDLKHTCKGRSAGNFQTSE